MTVKLDPQAALQGGYSTSYNDPSSTAASSSNTSPGVFDPSTVTNATVGGAPTYGPTGLTANLAAQRIYVGYLPPVTESGNSPHRGPKGEEGLPQQSQVQDPLHNQTVTAADLIKHFHDLATSTNPYTRQVWEQTQLQLQALDAYGTSTRINFGGWNPNDEAALTFALKGYLGGGGANVDNLSTMQTFEEYLKQQSAQGANNGLDGNQPGGPGSTGGKPKPILTNPDLVNQASDQQGQQLLGHALQSGELGAIVNQDHAEETTASNEGDVYLRSVTPQSVARTYILNNNLPEYAQHQVESYMNTFANMFLTGASSRANTSVGDAAVPAAGGGTA